VIIGSIVTFLSQLFFDSKRAKKELRKECITKYNEIIKNLHRITGVVNIILDFIDADFCDKDMSIENGEIYNRILHLYDEKRPYFGDLFIQDAFLLFPKTLREVYFTVFEDVVKESKNMSEEIRDYLESEEDFHAGMIELQASYSKVRDKYIVAKYVIYKLKDELCLIIKSKAGNDITRLFLKRNKRNIQNFMKKLKYTERKYVE